MVKYENLDWDVRGHLEQLWMEANPKPAEPAPYDPHTPPMPKVVSAGAGTRLFVEVPNDTRRQPGNHEMNSEAVLTMSIVTANETQHLTMTEGEVLDLIEELQQMVNALGIINVRRRTAKRRRKEHSDELNAWQSRQKTELRELLASGKITAEAIKLARKLEDLGYVPGPERVTNSQ